MFDILTDYQCQLIHLENCITDACEALDDGDTEKALNELQQAAYQSNEIQKALLRAITQTKKRSK